MRDLAEELAITMRPLPGDSPDFMPVEALWHWLREEFTYHPCYATAEELITRLACFICGINAMPMAVTDRLWTKTTVDPEEEKLRIPCLALVDTLKDQAFLIAGASFA